MCMCVLSVIRSNRQDLFFSHTLAGVSLVEVEETVADVMTANHAQGGPPGLMCFNLVAFQAGRFEHGEGGREGAL